jgi:parvulin-like peptidyl-prolyl isomerase
LSKKDLNDNSIIVNDSSLKFFYLANRNLEEPVFIKYEDLTEAQVLLIKKDYIKREVLKREALSWGLDKVDPVISSRLAQLGEQSLVNNLPEEEVSEEDLLSFYNKNNFLYIEDEKITFSHIFFRKDDDNIIDDIDYYTKSQNQDFFNANLLNKISIFPYQKNYAQRSKSFIIGHFGEETAQIIFSLSASEKWQGSIKSPYGLHILKISSISKAKQKTFAEVRNLVQKRFISEKKKVNLKLQIEKKILDYEIIETN